MSLPRRLSLTPRGTRVRRRLAGRASSPSTDKEQEAANDSDSADENTLTAFGDLSFSDEDEVRSPTSPKKSPSRIRRPPSASKRTAMKHYIKQCMEAPPESQFTQVLENHLYSVPGGTVTTREDFKTLIHRVRLSMDEGLLRRALPFDEQDERELEAAAGNSSLETSNSSAIPGTLLGAPSADTGFAKPPRGSSGILPRRRGLLPQWDMPLQGGDQ